MKFVRTYTSPQITLIVPEYTKPRDPYFTLFLDIHPGKVFPFYSVYLTNWEKLPIFGHFYPGRVFYVAVKYSPLQGASG